MGHVGDKKIGLDDDFFALGGHSLVATTRFRIHRRLGIVLSLSDILIIPSSAFCLTSFKKNNGYGTNIFPPREDNEPETRECRQDTSVPTTSAQYGLWYIDQLGLSVAFVEGGALEIRGPIVIEALNKAFISLVERHQSLRTVIKTSEGK